MRRFESTPSVRLQMPLGRWLEAWVAESFAVRLAGLACLRRLPPGRALLLPSCRSVHTVAMRFPIDVAFVSWPPAGGACEVMALEVALHPLRVLAPRALRCRRVAAIEAGAHTLRRLGVAPGARLMVEPRNPLRQDTCSIPSSHDERARPMGAPVRVRRRS
jgi:uncharacterized membrane protein (UPF0127 family)